MSVERDVTFTPAGTLKKNDYIAVENRPCRILEIIKAKTGKHGRMKCHVKSTDIFNGRNYECIYGSGDNVEVPVVTKQDYDLVDITMQYNDIYIYSLMRDGKIREDLMLPKDKMADLIKEAFVADNNVVLTVTSALDCEAITSFKLVA